MIFPINNRSERFGLRLGGGSGAHSATEPQHHDDTQPQTEADRDCGH